MAAVAKRMISAEVLTFETGVELVDFLSENKVEYSEPYINPWYILMQENTNFILTTIKYCMNNDSTGTTEVLQTIVAPAQKALFRISESNGSLCNEPKMFYMASDRLKWLWDKFVMLFLDEYSENLELQTITDRRRAETIMHAMFKMQYNNPSNDAINDYTYVFAIHL